MRLLLLPLLSALALAQSTPLAPEPTTALALRAELDLPPAARPPSRILAIPGAADEAIQVFYFPPSLSPQELEQVAIAARSVLQARYAYEYPSARAIGIRGPAVMLRTAAWLLPRLAAAPAEPETHQSPPLPAAEPPAYLAFPLRQVRDPELRQTLLTAARRVTRTRITSLSLGTIAARAEPADLASFAWLLGQLDHPTPLAAAETETATGRLAILPLPANLPAGREADATRALRAKLPINDLIPYPAGRALLIHAPAPLVDQARQMLAALTL